MLDEPTNHLDLDAVLWLEDWLTRYPGTLLLITHDRDFLDGVVDGIVPFRRARSSSPTPATIRSSSASALQLALQQATYVKQQRQIAHLQAFVDRFRAKATKAKQAQSRIEEALERMERIAAAHADSPFEFAFAPVTTATQRLVQLEHATLGYAGRPPVLEGLDWGILNGDRIGLLGPNGAGKSTLLKAIAGTLPPLAGRGIRAQTLSLGYFAQHQVEQLRSDESPLWHLAKIDPTAREQELRDFLGGFDFRGDMVTQPVGRFSGGEKARLTLALLVRQKPNLLLLDEPTNHLDIEMREALAEALQDYEGALVVVAHDRHLLRATTDVLWLVADGRVAPFDGDLDDYRDWVLARSRRPAESADASAASVAATARRRSVPRRKRGQRGYAQRKPLADKLAKLEREMAALNAERKTVEEWLASPAAVTREDRHGRRSRRGLRARADLAWPPGPAQTRVAGSLQPLSTWTRAPRGRGTTAGLGPPGLDSGSRRRRVRRLRPRSDSLHPPHPRQQEIGGSGQEKR